MQTNPSFIRRILSICQRLFLGFPDSPLRRSIRGWLVIGLVLGMGSFQACGSARVECKTNAECPDDVPTCTYGYCFKKCDSNGACGDGELCNSTLKVCIQEFEEVSNIEVTSEPNPSEKKEEKSLAEASKEKNDSEDPSSDDGDHPKEKIADGGDEPTSDSQESTQDVLTEPTQDVLTEPTQDASTEPTQDETQDRGKIECHTGEKRSCYGGRMGTMGVGPCLAGQQTCKTDGRWGACVGEVSPKRELCDKIDNDCDGQIDENFPQFGTSCTLREGECAGTGTYACTEDKKTLFCKVKGKQSVEEVCDGKDNDCDGLIDEGKNFGNLGDACFDGKGACRRQGSIICSANKKTTECNAKAGKSYPERCNGRDDDCDGQIDETFPTLGNPCTVGVGECAAIDKLVCNNTGTGVTCPAIAKKPLEEICDGKDNNCDGQIDNNIKVRPLCKQQNGVCKGTKKSCTNGKFQECKYDKIAPNFKPTETLCDGLDNDCNGQIDEPFKNLGKTCTIATCRGSYPITIPPGKFICDASKKKEVCDITLRKEICGNNTDDNCNGTIDEGCALCTAGENRSCYFGPPRTRGIGICDRDGRQTCSKLGVWGGCQGSEGGVQYPETEYCANSRDEDCDGLVDEGCNDCPFLINTYSFSDFRGSGAIHSITSYYSRVYTTSSFGIVKGWSFSRKKQDYTLGDGQSFGHIGVVNAIASTKYISTLITGGSDKNVIIWSAYGKLQHTFKAAHSESVTAVAITKDGQIGISGSADKTIKFWNISKKILAFTIPSSASSHTKTITGLALDLREEWLASSSEDKTVRVWDAKALRQSSPVAKSSLLRDCETRGPVKDVVFSPDGTILGAACGTDYVLWKIDTKTNLFKLFHAYPVDTFVTGTKATSLEFSSDGANLYGGSSNGRIFQYDLDATGTNMNKIVQTYFAGKLAIHDLVWMARYGTLASVSADGFVREWKCAGSVQPTNVCLPNRTLRTITGAHSKPLTSVVFSRFGKTFFSASDDFVIKHWDAVNVTSKPLATLSGHTAGITSLDISRNGRLLTSGSRDGTIRIWDVATRKLLSTTTIKNAVGKLVTINDVSFRFDGLALVGAGADGNLYLVDTATGKIIRSTASLGHVGAAQSVDCYPRSASFITSIGADGKVFMWDRDLKKIIRSWTAYTINGQRRIRYSNNGNLFTLSTAAINGEVIKRWTYYSGGLVKGYAIQTQLPLVSLTPSPDNRYIAAGGNGIIYMMDVIKGGIVRTLRTHNGNVTSFSWNFLGNVILSAGADRTLRIHDCFGQQPL